MLLFNSYFHHIKSISLWVIINPRLESKFLISQVVSVVLRDCLFDTKKLNPSHIFLNIDSGIKTTEGLVVYITHYHREGIFFYFYCFFYSIDRVKIFQRKVVKIKHNKPVICLEYYHEQEKYFYENIIYFHNSFKA